MTEQQIVDRLRLEAEQESQAELARRYGFSPSFMAQVIDGRARVSARLAEAMGYRRVVKFERVA